MLDREHNISNPLKVLADFLGTNSNSFRSFRRRAVIYQSNDKWVLLSCAVEALIPDRVLVDAVASIKYPQAILHEDMLSYEELLDFFKQIDEGLFFIDKLPIERTATYNQWSRERVPLSNDFMSSAGQVWISKFLDFNLNPSETLIAPNQPFYPDLFEAVKHWLSYPVHLRGNDFRKGEVVLLFPETRAYLADAKSEDGVINIRIAGTKVKELSLELKGAWWDETGIHHFENKVNNCLAQLSIPALANRLEYVLIDSAGEVYDRQYEDGYRHTGLGRKRIAYGDQALEETVRLACRDGEGLQIEFKPFIDLENGKFKEITKTVVAFANAKGGRIFIGIDDECGLLGIDEKLGKWAQTMPNETECHRYLGAIGGKIRNGVVGEPILHFKQTVVDGHRIAVIEVDEAKMKPISIGDDRDKYHLYIRRGSSNSKATPEEWKSIAGTSVNPY